MKFKAKINDYKLTVKVKFSSQLSVNEKELGLCSQQIIRGLLKPNLIKKNVIEYSGPAGITVEEKLKKPISKYDFYYILEQISITAKKMQKAKLPWNRVVWDIKNAYINEVTKELKLIYFPVNSMSLPNSSVMAFVERIVYTSRPVIENDVDYISKFACFLRTMEGYDPDKIESYIFKEDRMVVENLRRYSPSSSFLTDKREEYYKHYSEKEAQSGLDSEDATGLLDDENDATGILYDDEATGLLNYEDDEATGILNNEDDEVTGLLNDEGDETTGLLYDEEVTGLLNGENTETFSSTIGNAHFPSLLSITTKQKISVNKPVFRIGKERKYVDYFVMNNSAVSRSHADIITRGNRYFVMDLNSKNKTYLNDQVLPIKCEIEIFDGDRLRLANEEFIFNV